VVRRVEKVRALVTGATGFIGGHLVEELDRRGWGVRCLVREASDTRRLATLGFELVRGDYEEAGSLERAVEGVDYVFHLAAVISALEWEEYRRANVVATDHLLAACASRNPGLRRFVFVSSISAAGPSRPGRAKTEDDPCTPVSDYGRSKLLAEQAVLVYGERFPVVIVRPPNVIGPRQRELEEAIRLIRKRIMPAIGTGKPQTSLCYVADVVRALILCAEHPAAAGQVYFLADPRPYAWKEINQSIAAALGIRGFILKVPYFAEFLVAALSEAAARRTKSRPRLTRELVRAPRRHEWIFDGAKIRRELGFETSVGLEEAIERTVAWQRDQGGI
jgi:nucleoside-diphosphate-sugar epimerase